MFDVGKEIDHGLWGNVCENVSSYEGEDDGFRVTATEEIGRFDSFQDIADHIDRQIMANVSEITKINTMMGIVFLLQASAAIGAVRDAVMGDTNYLLVAQAGALLGIMTYIRHKNLKPHKIMLEESWEMAERFEERVDALQDDELEEPTQIYPGE